MCKCCYCGKKPEEIEEYIAYAKDDECTPLEFVVNNEGTYNSETGEFACTHCYIEHGMPLGKAPFTNVQVTPQEYMSSKINEPVLNNFISDIEQDFKDAGLKIRGLDTDGDYIDR